jgi:thiol:disulfide interchange protein DsbD
MNVTKFETYYTIEQKIKITDPSKPITGYLNYMTCNDERCLPPVDVDFELMPAGGSSGDATPSSSSPAAEKGTTKASEVVSTQTNTEGKDLSSEKKR